MALSFSIQYLNRVYFYCKTKLKLKIFWHAECFNDRDTFSPDCKHNHMLENGAPPDKIGALYCVLHNRIPWF